MNRKHKTPTGWIAPRAQLIVALLLVLAGLGSATVILAGDFVGQSNFGLTFFDTRPPCPVKDFPTFESIVPVPTFIDPFEQDEIRIFCSAGVKKNGQGVKKAKGTFESELIIIDHNTGMVETFPIKSGKFKTDSEGFDDFDFDIPTELFADGFESGDVSAWSYTRSSFSNKKKGDEATLQCATGASTGSN